MAQGMESWQALSLTRQARKGLTTPQDTGRMQSMKHTYTITYGGIASLQYITVTVPELGKLTFSVVLLEPGKSEVGPCMPGFAAWNAARDWLKENPLPVDVVHSYMRRFDAVCAVPYERMDAVIATLTPETIEA
jgi:hypothetical protein